MAMVLVEEEVKGIYILYILYILIILIYKYIYIFYIDIDIVEELQFWKVGCCMLWRYFDAGDC